MEKTTRTAIRITPDVAERDGGAWAGAALSSGAALAQNTAPLA